METEVNPFADESLSTVEEIREELAHVQRHEEYLIDLLAYYENFSDIPTDIQTTP